MPKRVGIVPRNILVHQVDDTTGIYVFDFSHIEDDFWKVVTGKYSELSKESKQKILSFFRGHTAHYAYIESYLKPDKYYGMYSEILNVKMVHFKKVKEWSVERWGEWAEKNGIDYSEAYSKWEKHLLDYYQ